MVNMKRVSKWFAALLFVVAVAGCAATPTRESTGQYLDDSVITAKVKAEIFNDPSLRALEISVRSNDGVVVLSGDVSSMRNADRAVEIARHVAGVRSVKNKLTVK